MKTEILNVKIDPSTKENARRIAEELGFSISSLVNAYLKHLIKTKTVYFSQEKEEIPSKWLLKELKQAEKDRKAGYVSPTFSNVKDSIAWLKDPKAKYINGKNAN